MLYWLVRARWRQQRKIKRCVPSMDPLTPGALAARWASTPWPKRHKLCPFSCIYCQYGPTAQPTLRRRTFVSPEQLQTDLANWGPIDCDQITFAGLGEPTLARNLARTGRVVRAHTHRPSPSSPAAPSCLAQTYAATC